MKYFFLGFLIVLSINSFGGKLEKGFEALAVFDYYNARELFSKTLDKQVCGAAFGLTGVYDTEKSPFFNIDSAYKYIVMADSAWREIEEKDKEKLRELEIDPEIILKKKKSISTFFFENAAAQNTVESYQLFIDNHPWSDERLEAIALRNHVAYQEAKKANTISSYQSYMERYPDAEEYTEAEFRYNELVYHSLVIPGDISSYRAFIVNRPDNPFVEEAEIELYKLYKAKNSAIAYQQYIRENPESPYHEDAWRRFFLLKTYHGTPEEIADFLFEYQDYPNRKEVSELLDRAEMTLLPCRKDNKWGCINTYGEWVIGAKYEWALPFKEGKALVGLLGYSVFIDYRGALTFNHLFDDAQSFEEGLAVAEKEEALGMINFFGDTALSFEYEEIGILNNGVILTRKDGKYIYYDDQGKQAIPGEYDNALDFKDNKAIVKKGGKWGVVNILGQPLIKFEYDALVADSNLFIARSGLKYGILSALGDTILPFEFERIGGFHEGLCIASSEGKFSYYNRKGEMVIKGPYDFTDATLTKSQFNNGYARVLTNSKYGIIDHQGKKVYPAIFDDLGEYNPNLTAVNKGGKWGYANSDVRLIHPYKYSYASDFQNGLAIVELNGQAGVINTSNELVIPMNFDKIEPFEGSLFITDLNGSKGIVDQSNTLIIPVIYETIVHFDGHIITLSKEEGADYFDINNMKYIYKESAE
ncbi:MAG TPA: hypothetical protein DDX92_10925 [Flavobacteriales bacterium]|jgi:hypothetical protein|nr:hypothetical protein [Flavobacteriales bacterium]